MAPERDDDAPIAPLDATPAGWELAGSFRVFSGRMAVGEYPVSDGDDRDYGNCRQTILAACVNGDWFALSREYEDDDLSGDEFVIVTRNAAAQIEALMKKLELLGAVAVEGGSVHLLDEEVRDDKRYQRELETGSEPLGRGFIAVLRGDGATEIFGAHAQGGTDLELFYVKS
jgi:hypothetical protein